MTKHITVLGQKIKVQYGGKLLEETDLGAFEYMSMTINLKKELKDFKELHDKVLTHELIHAILMITGLNQFLRKDSEEAFCQAMEFALRPFLKENIL